MFIRETELVRLDDWADKMEKRVVSGEFLKDTKDRRNTSLVRENDLYLNCDWKKTAIELLSLF